MTGSLSDGMAARNTGMFQNYWSITATFTPREGGGTFNVTVVPGAEENDYARNEMVRSIQERKRETDFEAIPSEIKTGLDNLSISRAGANGNQVGYGDKLTISTAQDPQRAGTWRVLRTTPQSGDGVTLHCVENSAFAESGGGMQ